MFSNSYGAFELGMFRLHSLPKNGPSIHTAGQPPPAFSFPGRVLWGVSDGSAGRGAVDPQYGACETGEEEPGVPATDAERSQQLVVVHLSSLVRNPQERPQKVPVLFLPSLLFS